MSTPRRYQFDNPLPAEREAAPPVVYQPQPLTPQYADQPPQVVVQHIHQAPPDRTVQRLTVGAGMGAGTVAAGVTLGPLLIAAMTSMAISLAVLALAVTVIGWTVHTVIRSVGGPDGQAAAKAIGKSRKRT